MIEYLYDAIRATAGQEIVVAAVITDIDDLPITSGCSFSLYDDDRHLQEIDGSFNSDTGEWHFVLPVRLTQTLAKGRYWYCINYEHQSLSFKQPLYLV